MKLEIFLRKNIQRELAELQKSIKAVERSLDDLDHLNLSDENCEAEYVVCMGPMYCKNLFTSVEIKHCGTLRDVIEKAESNYKVANIIPLTHFTKGVSCSVDILLGDEKYEIPEEYWKQYRKGTSSG